MSELSLDQRLGPIRKLSKDELRVLKKILTQTGVATEFEDQLAAMKVQTMADGGMGSIRFYNGRDRSPLDYGEQIAEAAFQDSDGMPVSITLSIDTIGDLFEMDVFKADFSPLIRYPDLADLAIIKRDERGNVVSNK
jgi:uncharacterized protein DUF6984